MTTEKEFGWSVERYQMLVRQFSALVARGAEAPILRYKFRQVKAEHDRYLALKFALQQQPTQTTAARLRFKAAHAEMRAMEEALAEKGILLRVEAVGIPIEGTGRHLVTNCNKGSLHDEGQPRRGVWRSVALVTVGLLLPVKGVLRGLYFAGYL
jgi:hypothetical protein